MIKRPKISDLRKSDPEIVDEIVKGTTRIDRQTKQVFLAIGFSFVVYIAVIYFYQLSFTTAWLIGFPLFLILIGLGLIGIQIFQLNDFNTTITEYYSRHILHRLEEVDKTLNDKKNKNNESDKI